MKNIIILIFLLSSSWSFGQDYTIKSKFIKSGNIKMDSIEVQISVFEDRIETESHFEKSKSKLNVTYFKNGTYYNTIKTRENSSSFADCCRINEFDLEDGKISNAEESYYSPKRMSGIDGKFEEVKVSYNKTFSSKFIEKYVLQLFENTKNYR